MVHHAATNASIFTSVSPVGPPVAGYNFTLTCSATQTEGLSGTPTLSWVNAEGQPITSSGDIMLGAETTSGLTTTRTLYFDPIRTSDGGSYTCVAALMSSGLNTTLSSSANYTITVQQSKTNIMNMYL